MIQMLYSSTVWRIYSS